MVFGESTQHTSDLIRNTRQLAQGVSREQTNRLSAAYTGGDTMTLRFPVGGIQIGHTIEIGWTTYSVAEVDTATHTLGVVEEIAETAEPADEGTRVIIRPRYPAKRIIHWLNIEITNLSALGVYKLDLIEADEHGTAPLPPDVITIVSAWSREKGLLPRKLPESSYRVVDVPEGLELRGPATLEHVMVGRPFGQLPSDEDVNVTQSTGLWATALDIPPLGAAVNMLAGSESQRNIIDHQGETRRANEVPPGSIGANMRSLATLKHERVVAESQRLLAR
jgi:hypothetical protein